MLYAALITQFHKARINVKRDIIDISDSPRGNGGSNSVGGGVFFGLGKNKKEIVDLGSPVAAPVLSAREKIKQKIISFSSTAETLVDHLRPNCASDFVGNEGSISGLQGWLQMWAGKRRTTTWAKRSKEKARNKRRKYVRACVIYFEWCTGLLSYPTISLAYS